nr:hypothetical protein [Methanosarcina barkeri]
MIVRLSTVFFMFLLQVVNGEICPETLGAIKIRAGHKPVTRSKEVVADSI